MLMAYMCSLLLRDRDLMAHKAWFHGRPDDGRLLLLDSNVEWVALQDASFEQNRVLQSSPNTRAPLSKVPCSAAACEKASPVSLVMPWD